MPLSLLQGIIWRLEECQWYICRIRGEGNAINPIASLLSKDVYGIPVIFVIGWRGEPGIHDEPQHAYQGKITLKLLDDMNITYFIIDNNTKDKDVIDTMDVYRQNLSDG